MDTPREVLDWLYEKAQKKSDYELDLCNVLDVKGGIFLAVIALVASDPLHVFVGAPNVPLAKALELTFGALLFLSAVFAVCELWPRKYRTDLMPAENRSWVTRLKKHFEDYPADGTGLGDAVRGQVISGMLERLEDRIPENKAFNSSKILCLSWSFRFAVLGMAIYLISALALKGI